MTKEELIEELIREGFLKTPRIIEAFRAIDRADFVLPEYRAEAYGNYPLPIGSGQTISQPLTVAFLLELLQPQPGETILDVGSGSGWTVALLAYLVGPRGRVIGVERVPELCRFGEANAERYGLVSRGTARFLCGDASAGTSRYAPFDKVLSGAAASREIPAAWREQLKINGRIVAPVDGSVWLFVKKPAGWEEKEYPGFAFVPLVRNGKKEAREETARAARKQKRSGGSWMVRGITAVLTLGVIAGLAAIEIYLPHPASQERKTVAITPGMGSRTIGEALKRTGIIRSTWTFVAYATLNGLATDLKPGTYRFQNLAIPQIVQDLVSGENREQSVTIPEGWTTTEIATRLEEEGVAASTEFTEQIRTGGRTFGDEFAFLTDKPAGEGLEGYLFPDTYRLFTHTPVEGVIQRMLANFDRRVALELRDEIQRQRKTLFEVITMASLIEKEVAPDKDRALVSGILWKRLRLGIPLQVDATITYIKNQKSKFKNQNNGKISVEDTKIDSPYNTYLNRGLPKGPIANPGLSAIRAAIYPKDSPYLYYLSTMDGRTIFSRTLEEHNLAKNQHLR